MSRYGTNCAQSTREILGLIATVALLPAVLPSVSLATECVIFVIATLGCNLLLGRVGLLSFGQGIFFGAGSYATGLAIVRLGAGPVFSLLAALLLGSMVAALIGSLAARRRGVYFIMLTLAFTQMCYFLAFGMSGVTGGDNGLLGVSRPPLSFLGTTLLPLDSDLSFYALCSIICVAVYALLARVTGSPFGAVLVAIRENESRTFAVGYNPLAYKILAFVLSGMVTAVAGGLYAMFLRFVPLSNIDISMSERILIMTMLGGVGSLFGGVIGAVTVVVLSHLLSDLWSRWILLLGLVLIVVAVCLPGGLWSALQWIATALRRGVIGMSPRRAHLPLEK